MQRFASKMLDGVSFASKAQTSIVWQNTLAHQGKLQWCFEVCSHIHIMESSALVLGGCGILNSVSVFSHPKTGVSVSGLVLALNEVHFSNYNISEQQRCLQIGSD